MIGDLPARRAFAQLFFAEGNQLKWAAIRDRRLPSNELQALQPWLDDLMDPACSRVLLPRVREDDTVSWYALCADARDARALREELLAVVGPSYSTFRGQPFEPVEDDPVDNVVSLHAGSHAFRLDVPDPALASQVRYQLARLRTLWRNRPPRKTGVARPLGRILRDFELAIRQRDRRRARGCLREIDETNQVSAMNRTFLEARRRGGLEEWSRLLEPGFVDELLAMRLPRRVTELLLVGLYRTQLAAYERADDPSGALTHFREGIAGPYRALFASRAAMRTLEASKMFMLLSAMDPPRPQTRDAILAESDGTAPDRPWLERLAALVPDAAPPDTRSVSERATGAASRGDVDLALSLLTDETLDRSGLVQLLMLTHVVSTRAAARRALEALDRASPDDKVWLRQNALYGPLVQAFEDRVTGPDVPDPRDWLEWVEALADERFLSHAVASAEAGANEWDTSGLTADSTAVRRLADALVDDTLSPVATDVVRQCVPHALHALSPGGRSHVSLAPVYEALFYILAVDERRSTLDLYEMVDLARALIEAGRTPGDYAVLLDDIRAAWGEIQAPPSTFGWALDAVDLFAMLPCPAPDALGGLLGHVGAVLERFPMRVEPEQARTYASLCHELSGPAVSRALTARGAERGETEKTLADLVGRSFVAIYSITERLTRTTGEHLAGLCPDARIKVFHDKAGGSPALVSAARTADIFVIFTQQATHAATGTIDQHRPADKVTLRPKRIGRQAVQEELMGLLHSM